MTISISEQDWAAWEEELSHLIEAPDPDDSCDRYLPQPTWIAQGCARAITLRDGLDIRIEDYQMRDRCEIAWADSESGIRFHCHLSGDHHDALTEVGNLEYALYGNGITPKHTTVCSGQFPILEVIVEMSPEVLIGFAGAQGELPLELQHLMGGSDQSAYARVGILSPTMQSVLRQMIRCPYRGLMKRMYLESKALEIAMLILEQEQAMQQGQRSICCLKSEEVDRIHYAREILLRNLEEPPSLTALARQVGLNEKSLKQGFRRVFGKPVFGYLHDYRMDQAQQLLIRGELKVGEVMQRVGFRDRGNFAAAFRKKFGVNPRAMSKSS